MKRKILVLIISCLMTFIQSQSTQWNSKALQRLMHQWDVKLEKMELHLQASMRRAGMDNYVARVQC